MKVKTSQTIWGVLILIGLSQGDRVGEAVSRGDRIRQERADFAEQIRINKGELREAEKLSEIAVQRYQNNCVLVVDAQTEQESLFQPGAKVVQPNQQDKTLRAGLLICNRLGDTAKVSQNGTITDVARVSTADISMFEQLLEARGR